MRRGQQDVLGAGCCERLEHRAGLCVGGGEGFVVFSEGCELAVSGAQVLLQLMNFVGVEAECDQQEGGDGLPDSD